MVSTDPISRQVGKKRTFVCVAKRWEKVFRFSEIIWHYFLKHDFVLESSTSWEMYTFPWSHSLGRWWHGACLLLFFFIIFILFFHHFDNFWPDYFSLEIFSRRRCRCRRHITLLVIIWDFWSRTIIFSRLFHSNFYFRFFKEKKEKTSCGCVFIENRLHWCALCATLNNIASVHLILNSE